jgi:hypothetical protein
LGFLEKFKVFINKEREERKIRLIGQGKRVPSNRALSLYLMSIKKLFNEAKRVYNKKYKKQRKGTKAPACSTLQKIALSFHSASSV